MLRKSKNMKDSQQFTSFRKGSVTRFDVHSNMKVTEGS